MEQKIFDKSGKRSRRGNKEYKTYKWLIVTGCSFLLTFSLWTPSVAQSLYPQSDIDFVQCTNPGGGMDLSARLAAAYLTEHLRVVAPGAKGGNVIVRNMPGASGNKAYNYVYNARPNGYIIGDYVVGHLYEHLLTDKKPPFDVSKFTWLFASNMSAYMMLGHKQGPKTWDEMMALSKKRPLKWLVGQHGSSMHMNSLWVREEVGMDAKLLIVQGAAGVVAGLLRGDGDVTLIPLDSGKAIVDSGDANVLLTFTQERYFPDAPTSIEKGYPQFLPHISGYRLVMAPPNLDPQAYNTLTEAARRMQADPKYREAVKGMQAVPASLAGKEVEKAVEDRIEFYKSLDTIVRKYLN